ncbi:hypothetical protein [Hymenobacter sp. HDW8]|uniref:hypothetical protein n=1 Tax=Hymenobacter sp. HDW8 TaxID=2714932 RepID=UPI00140B983A|nr:hypothetical protein [Hymenobacter sp. HDW8]QIL77551.1 hypothetical protein G7064_18170 [Hymenobacter sp. HDW8]
MAATALTDAGYEASTLIAYCKAATFSAGTSYLTFAFSLAMKIGLSTTIDVNALRSHLNVKADDIIPSGMGEALLRH